jgi:hypothetical protein
MGLVMALSHEIEIKAMVCMQFSAKNFPHVRQCGHNPESYILYAERNPDARNIKWLFLSFSFSIS